MTRLTDQHLARVREKASAATPGPYVRGCSLFNDRAEMLASVERDWLAGPDSAPDEFCWVGAGVNTDDPVTVCATGNGPKRSANRDYLAEVDPQTVLAMIEEIEAARKAEMPPLECPHDMQFDILICGQCGRHLHAHQASTIARLEAKVAELERELQANSWRQAT